MWNFFLSIVLVLVAVYLSMAIRVNRIHVRRSRKTAYEERPSPLSEAIKDFVAIAGGVYIGLTAMAEFLKVPVPIEASLWGTRFDPVALFAISLAILAPVIPVGKNRL